MAPKTAQEAPKRAPGRAKKAPIRPRESLNTAQLVSISGRGGAGALCPRQDVAGAEEAILQFLGN